MEAMQDLNRRLIEMLKELRFHDKQGYGRWTRGMRERVAALIGKESTEPTPRGDKK